MIQLMLSQDVSAQITRKDLKALNDSMIEMNNFLTEIQTFGLNRIEARKDDTRFKALKRKDNNIQQEKSFEELRKKYEDATNLRIEIVDQVIKECTASSTEPGQ